MACCGRAPKPNFAEDCYVESIEKIRERIDLHRKNTKVLFDEISEGGMTPLHRAAQSGRVEVVEVLLDKQFDTSSVNEMGETPLHLACFDRNLKVVEALLKKSSIQTINAQENVHGMTALHIASLRGAPDCAEAMLCAGADPGILCKNSCTPMDLCKSMIANGKLNIASPRSDHNGITDLLGYNGTANRFGMDDTSPTKEEPKKRASVTSNNSEADK